MTIALKKSELRKANLRFYVYLIILHANLDLLVFLVESEFLSDFIFIFVDFLSLLRFRWSRLVLGCISDSFIKSWIIMR